MSRGVEPECASGGQRASLPTGSLEAAGASGAALGCAEAETPPPWAPVHQPGQSLLHKGPTVICVSTLESVAHLVYREAARTIVWQSVITHVRRAVGCHAGLCGESGGRAQCAHKLQEEWKRASRQKGHIAAQGIVSPVALPCPGKVS